MGTGSVAQIQPSPIQPVHTGICSLFLGKVNQPLTGLIHWHRWTPPRACSALVGSLQRSSVAKQCYHPLKFHIHNIPVRARRGGAGTCRGEERKSRAQDYSYLYSNLEASIELKRPRSCLKTPKPKTRQNPKDSTRD